MSTFAVALLLLQSAPVSVPTPRPVSRDAANRVQPIINELRADVSRPLFRTLTYQCDSLQQDEDKYLDCYLSLATKTSDEKRLQAGLVPAGVTWRGYSQILVGMEHGDVEFLLGDYGEQAAFSGGGGYSFEIRKWAVGRRMISVSFANGSVSGKSQLGL